MEIIIGREGTQKLPITDKTVSRRHCSLIPNGDGTYTLKNLSDSGTKVDGIEIIRTTVKPGDQIQLGIHYKATLGELLGINSSGGVSSPTSSANSKTQNQTTQNQGVKTYNISHLKKVWDDFNEKNIEAAEQQRKINLIRTGFGVFTMCAMPMIFFFGAIGYVLTGIGVLGNIYSFVGMKNSETVEDRQRRQDEFDDAWVCPNPECGRSLPARNYKYLVRNHQSCPYCKCRYVEK